MSGPVLNGPPKQKRLVPRVENGEIVPDVRRREIRTFGLMADEAMEQLPRQVVDLSDPDMRARMESWIYGVIRSVAHNMEWSYRRATDSALQQASELMRDPNRYEKQHASRKQQREKFEARMKAFELDRQQRMQERREFIQGLADEGKVVPMPGLVFDLPCCTGKPDPEQPEPEGAK